MPLRIYRTRLPGVPESLRPEAEPTPTPVPTVPDNVLVTAEGLPIYLTNLAGDLLFIEVET